MQEGVQEDVQACVQGVRVQEEVYKKGVQKLVRFLR
jgi:hypothetical protein